jgi:hypothetical protein
MVVVAVRYGEDMPMAEVAAVVVAVVATAERKVVFHMAHRPEVPQHGWLGLPGGEQGSGRWMSTPSSIRAVAVAMPMAVVMRCRGGDGDGDGNGIGVGSGGGGDGGHDHVDGGSGDGRGGGLSWWR